MPRLLAIEWNDVEARAIVASGRGGRVCVEQAFVVSLLPATTPSSGAPSEGDVGRRLAAALAARGIGRLDALVAAERAHVELRQLGVPPCPADELPDVVRFQAMKEFNALKEDWPLDFMPLDGDPPQSVLAATADPAWVEGISTVLDQAGSKLRRLVLRPCATASLWRRREGGAGSEVRLLVDVLDTEAELTVLFGRRESFLRSARLATEGSDDEARASLVAEIRRTMVAAQNQLGGRRVESIVLIGAADHRDEATKRLADELGVPIQGFDPLAGVDADADARAALEEQPGRFAALIGMAWDELDRVPPTIDFLHPRQRHEPQGRRNALAAAGLALAILLLAGVSYGVWARQDIARRTSDLSKTSRELEPQAVEADKIQRAAGEIEQWVDQDLVWLDELRWLCDTLPPAEDAMLTQLSFHPTAAGNEIEMQGYARSIETIKKMERAMRDARHTVVGRSKSEDPAQKPYTMRFRSSVLINREEP